MTTIIKTVGNVAIDARHRATCHCGSIVFELSLPDGIVDPRRCDCSMCRRKGAIVASVPLAGLAVIEGHDVIRLYQFNTKMARHYFCGNCGIHTHHQRRSKPTLYSYNVGCLEGVNPYDIEDVALYDGVNHPADKAVFGYTRKNCRISNRASVSGPS